jgi:hypothetical protein
VGGHACTSRKAGTHSGPASCTACRPLRERTRCSGRPLLFARCDSGALNNVPRNAISRESVTYLSRGTYAALLFARRRSRLIQLRRSRVAAAPYVLRYWPKWRSRSDPRKRQTTTPSGRYFERSFAPATAFVNDPRSDRATVFATWQLPEGLNFVAELAGKIVGAYLLRPNNIGLGSHVANASFAVAQEARGQASGGQWVSMRSRRPRGSASGRCNSTQWFQRTSRRSRSGRALASRRSAASPVPFTLRGERYADALVMYRELC